MKFNNYNSDEYKILNELFNTMPLMDTNIANIIEEYIYSTVREYYSNGSIKCEYRTKYGEKDGEYKVWWSNGRLWKQTHYIDDKRQGIYKEWYSNGVLWEDSHYENDKFKGEYKEWDRTGKLIEKINYL